MIIIGIAGGTGSGKTTVVKKIVEALPQGEVSVLPKIRIIKIPAIFLLKKDKKSTSTNRLLLIGNY